MSVFPEMRLIIFRSVHLLDKAGGHIQFFQGIQCGKILGIINRSAYKGKFHSPICRIILGHQGNRNLRRQFVGNPCQVFPGIRQIIGQDQMPDNQTMPGNTLFIRLQITDLPVHFLYGCSCCLPVIITAGVLPGCLIVGIFQIRQINIDDAFKQF